MFKNIRKIFKWGVTKNSDHTTKQSSLLFNAFIGFVEDVLLWKYNWLSISFILFFNVIFFISAYKQVSLIRISLLSCLSALGIDALETWLKHKHRTSFLKRIAQHDGKEFHIMCLKMANALERKWFDLIFLREKNPTKGFLLVNVIFTSIFIIGYYVDGYVLVYLLCMFIFVSKKVTPPLCKVIKKIQQHAESDAELEGLIPELTEGNIQLLSIEPEPVQDIDERQSLDLWKPEDLPLDDASDSSDNSSSLVSNLVMAKNQSIEKDIETSDSSEDEYIPLVQQEEQLQSTLEVSSPVNTWSSTAYNTLWNFTGTVANMVYSTNNTKKKKMSSGDSSDGFEMVDKSELM